MLTPSPYSASGATAKRLATLGDPPSVSLPLPLLLLSLSLFLSTAVSLQQSLLTIDASAAPGTSTSLQYYLCGSGASELSSDTTLQLSGGVHRLQEGAFCLVQNLENFKVRGQEAPPRTVIECQSEREMRRGITFFNITNLHLSHIDISNCGREIPSGLPGYVNDTFTYLGPLQKAVLIVTHSTDVTVESVGVDRCLGFGLLFINPLGNTTTRGLSVTNTSSSGLGECAQPLERADMFCAGSGAVFVFSDTNITRELVESGINYTASLSVINCSLINNSNWIPTNALLDLLTIIGVGFSSERILLTGGVSLAIFLGQRDYFVDVKITDTTISSNYGNIASFVVLHYNTISTSRTRLDRVVANDNEVLGAQEMSRGGCLIILVTLFSESLHSFPQMQGDVYDIAEVSRSNFSRNSAHFGGGIMLYMTPQNISDVRLVILDSVFTENIADFGSALYAFQFQSLVNNRGSYIYMEDVVATGNSFQGANISDNSPENAGVFLVSHSTNVTLVGTREKGCLFRDNRVSVFATVRANVVLRGRIFFEGNHGFRGGALSLLDSSVLFIHNGSTIRFSGNTAFQEGGAIYSNTLGSSVTDTCSIQFLAERRIGVIHEELRLLNLSIVFSNNSALISGNSIFGNPLYDCFFLPISSVDHTNIVGLQEEILYQEVFDFSATVGNQLSEISSTPEAICICRNTTFSLEDCTLSHRLDRPIIPGDRFTVFLDPVDIAGNPVTSLLYSFLRPSNSSHSAELGVNQEVRPLPGLTECSSVEFQIFAPENIGLFIDLFVSFSGFKATVELNTTSCPPGFILDLLDDVRVSCVCSEFIERRLRSTCNLSDYTIARPTNYWVGLKPREDGGTIIQFVSTCPINYCREELTDVDLRVPDQLCVEGRTGTLCGACRGDLSSVFGTAECRKCSNAWLATLPLFALIGALLVIIAFLLDFTITHGLVNGLFFYSNIVMVNANIFFRGNQTGFLFFFLSWVNLDVGFPLCFYDGMTEPAKLGLQYVFPTYNILMIALIIALSQRSLLVQRLLSQLDGIHILVSMLYISFLKLFRTVIDTITFVGIVSEDKTEGDLVWFFDGNQQLSDPLSIVLIILGAFTLFGFILPYVGFVSFSTFIQRRVNSTRLNAYLDASLAPYKNQLRFWFGARLILTSVIYIIIANRGTDNPAFTLTLELSFLVGFTVIQAYIQPFKNLGVALLDLSFLLNLIALIIATSYTIAREELSDDQEALVITSISLVFVTNAGIFLWHLRRRLRKNEKIRKKTDEVAAIVRRFLSALRQRDRREIMEMMAKKDNEEDVVGGEGGVAGAPSSGRFSSRSSEQTPPKVGGPPSTTLSLSDMEAAPQEEDKPPQHLSSSQLREPVLDFIDDTQRHTA